MADTLVLKDGKESINKIEIFLKEEKKEKDEKKEDKIEIPKKSKLLSIILAFFLGRYGIHHLYLGRPTLFFVYFILSRYDFMVFVGVAEAFIYFITDKEAWLKDHGSDKIKK